MNKFIYTSILCIILFSCSISEKERVTNLLKEKIGDKLPFNEIKMAKIESGIAVIVDGSWCYWIDENDKIYCVNGTSKSVFIGNSSNCEDAPIDAMFSDIEKIAK